MVKAPQTIVVFCPNWVGDVVMATPAFDCLRANYPNSTIIGITRRYVRGVVEDGPWFDRLIDCENKTIRGFYRMVKQIRRHNPDIAILFPNSFRSALTVWLASVKKIYGYRRDGRTLLLSGGPKPIRAGDKFLPLPMMTYYMEICRWLNLKIPDLPKPSLFISDSLRTKGRQLIEKYGIHPGDRIIGLNPGAQFGSSKCWPPENFARLADLLKKRWTCKILLFIGPGEEEIARSILSYTEAEIIDTGPDRIDLALLKYFIQQCNLLITNDTGPRHYAVALGIPVVVLMGPTDPRYTAENLEKTVVLRRDIDCAPCHKKICPTDHRCMREISPQTVFQESEKLLGKSG